MILLSASLSFNLCSITVTPGVRDAQLSDRPTLPLLTFMPTKCGGALRIIQRIGQHYKKLGRLLLEDDTGAITEGIIAAHPHQPEHIISDAILARWLDGTGRQPVTWATLIAVLKEIDLMQLARDVEKQGEYSQFIHNPTCNREWYTSAHF